MFTKLRISCHNLSGRHKDQRQLLLKIDIVIIVLVEILKMKCTLFVTVNYVKIYVPNFLKKSLILCVISPNLDLNKKLL